MRRTRLLFFINNITRLFRFLFPKREKVRHDMFYAFHKQYSNLSSKRYYNFDSLYEEAPRYSHYIVGSDQVWNFTNGFSPEPYFLTFVKSGKKISYAASLRHDNIPKEIAPIYKSWISDFDYVSLREAEGAKAVSDLIRKEVPVVLDPTLLIDKYEWLKALDIKKSDLTTKYVLVYLLSKSEYSVSLAKKIASQIGGTVKIIATGSWSPYMFTQGLEHIYTAGPKEFVELFSGASFVITNSFHGTAFSINFNIPFYSTPRKGKKTNSRFISLLRSLEIEDRIIYDGTNIETIDMANSLNYKKANDILDDMRNASITFLKVSLR